MSKRGPRLFTCSCFRDVLLVPGVDGWANRRWRVSIDDRTTTHMKAPACVSRPVRLTWPKWFLAREKTSMAPMSRNKKRNHKSVRAHQSDAYLSHWSRVIVAEGKDETFRVLQTDVAKSLNLDPQLMGLPRFPSHYMVTCSDYSYTEWC